jgi:hypothetical protein
MVNNKFIIFLLVLVYTHIGLFCQSEEKIQRVLLSKVILEFEIPLKKVDESRKNQINHLLGVADLIDQKKQTNLFEPFNKKERIRVSRSLKKAADLEDDKCFKDYLTNLSKSILEYNRFFCDYPRWIDLTENQVEMVFARDDYLYQSLSVLKTFFNINSEGIRGNYSHIYNTFVYLNHKQYTEKFQEYTDLFAKLQDNLPLEKSLVTAYSPIIPAFKIADLLHASSVSGFTLIYPDIQFEKEESYHQEGGGFKIILFQNLAKSYYEEMLKPVSGLVLTENCLLNLNYDSFLSNLIMIRISHHLGPIFFLLSEDSDEWGSGGDKTIKKKKEKELKIFTEVFQELFPIVELLKSQVLAIYNTPILIENGLIPEDKEVEIYTTHFVTIFDQLRHINSVVMISGTKTKKDQREVIMKNEKILTALVQYNFLLEWEGVIFNINNQKYEIDTLKYRSACEALVNQLFSYILTGKTNLLEKFLERYATISPELRQSLKLLRPLPVYVEFQPATK